FKPHPAWPDPPPAAADCYRYCLAQPAVHLVLTAPKSIGELDQNLAVLKAPPMNDDIRRHWERYGDIIYKNGGGRTHEYESRWP
ncbi:MAG: hypothetical protein WD229_00775, partial [Pirellulales bacterium]